MSGLLTRPDARPAPSPSLPAKLANGSPGAAPARPEIPARDSLVVRLGVFAALAAFGAAHWVGLVAEPPTGRMLLMVAIATAGAGALGLLGALPGRVRFALAALVLLALLVAGFLAAGLHGRLLLPRGIGDLLDGVDRGLGGVRTVDWPYVGAEHWVRLTILLGAPLLLGIAAGLAFWPARRGAAWLRGAGLVTLLVLYGVAATEHNSGKPLLRGFALLLLVAAWLWLPRLQPREALSGIAAVVAVGIVAIPFSVQLDAKRPLWDYRSFDWFGGGKVVSFDWPHSYGPLDWPRDGTTLMNVRSSKPHYWKAETLDLFDGFRWDRAGARTTVEATRRAYGELPSSNRAEGKTWDYFEFNPAWDARFRVTVRALRSDLIVGAGTTRGVLGAGTTNIASDGTTQKLTSPLEKGDSYRVDAYVPTPTAAQMRGAPQQYSNSMRAYTTIYVPQPAGSSLPGEERSFKRGQPGAPTSAVFAALRGEGKPAGSDHARRDLLRTPYGRVYRLAHRLTDGKATVYEAVKSVENYLKRNYRYNERPPTRPYPLAAFLFQDKIGYCQQFSGAMGLMLRMAGIPARVATGFTRGSYNKDTGEYRIRDLDAHSWVEVQFTGIGWVAFDPTPAATPAQGQASGLDTSPAAISGQGGGPNRDAPTSDRASDSGGRKRSSGAIPGWLALLGLVVLGGAGGGAFLALRAARTRRAQPPRCRAELQLIELRRALAKLGWSLPGGTTLVVLEQRLRRAAGPASAGYAARLRANRYDPDPPEPPGPADRRALRRELSGGGVRGRLRAVLVLPPWGPAPPQ